MKDKLSSRKFILSVLTLLISSVLVYVSKISDGVYSTIVVATIGSYIAGNVLQKKE